MTAGIHPVGPRRGGSGRRPFRQMQPVPAYTEEDLARVLARDFPAGEAAQVMRLLSSYGVEDWHREVLRVRMACLKLAGGDLERLRVAIATALVDFRDVLAPAEYPRYLRATNDAGRRRAVEEDWRELQQWLR